MSTTVKSKREHGNGAQPAVEKKKQAATMPQSAAAPSPFTPIADYAFLSDCHTGRARGARRDDRLAVRAAVRLAERVRGAARSRRGRVPVRPVRDQRAERPDLRAGDEHAGHVVEDADRLGRRARRADDGTAPRRGHDHAAHAAAGGRGRRPRARADGRVHRGQRRDRAGVRAGLRLRPRAGRVDARAGSPSRRGDRRRVRRSRLQTDMLLGIEGNQRPSPARRCTRASELFCALSWADEATVPTHRRGGQRSSWHATTRFWRDWLARARIPDHELRPLIQRSALTIKGLTYMPTGATVAALTTSLPETPGGERNWDYRYTWMRDSTFTLQALHYLDLDWEADEFMQFIADLERNDDGALQIMYGIDGRRDLTEIAARGPVGLRRRPARSGSATARSTSARTTCSAPCSTRSCCTRRRSQRLPRRLWPLVQAQAECATAVWRQPDQGIWEARGKPQHYVSSKLMCWVAMDRAAQARGDPRRAGPRRRAGAQTAAEIKADILEHGVDKRGVLRQHYETDALDASTLLAAIFGFLAGRRRAPARDACWRSPTS